MHNQRRRTGTDEAAIQREHLGTRHASTSQQRERQLNAQPLPAPQCGVDRHLRTARLAGLAWSPGVVAYRAEFASSLRRVVEGLGMIKELSIGEVSAVRAVTSSVRLNVALFLEDGSNSSEVILMAANALEKRVPDRIHFFLMWCDDDVLEALATEGITMTPSGCQLGARADARSRHGGRHKWREDVPDVQRWRAQNARC